jgi:hypothetical protein
MFTSLPNSTPFVCKDRGSYRIWQVCELPTQKYPTMGTHAYSGLHDTTAPPTEPRSRKLLPGEVIYFCVWKGNTLESRKSYVLQEGDVTFIDTGETFIDWTKPATKAQGHWSSGRPIFKNVFGGKSPAWLKGCN